MSDNKNGVQIPEELKDTVAQLKKNLVNLGDLEERIKAGEAAGEGVADLKEKVNKISTDNADLIDEIHEKQAELAERQDGFETKLAKAGMVADGAPADPLESFIDAVKESPLAHDERGTVSVPLGSEEDFVPAATFAKQMRGRLENKEVQLVEAGGLASVAGRGIFGPGQLDPTVQDLVGTSPTDDSFISYIQEQGVTDNAGIQEEGALKGETVFELVEVNHKVETVAHTTKITTQQLQDYSQLRSYISGRMMYLLEQAVSRAILNASGTFTGIKAAATAYDATLDDNVQALQQLDVLRAAILQVRLADLPADGVVLNPLDWFIIETLKNANNNYLLANGQGDMVRPWGLRVSSTTAQAADEFTVGAFGLGAEVLQRGGVRVEASTENEDDFQRNRATLRAEVRMALAIYRPSAFVDGDFSVALTGA